MTTENQKTCYALRIYSYDYYEWEEDIAVSFDTTLLKEYYERDLGHLYDDAPLVDASKHQEYQDGEKPHWIITPITFLSGKAS
jgi:hypothetical protein